MTWPRITIVLAAAGVTGFAVAMVLATALDPGNVTRSRARGAHRPAVRP